MSLAFQSWKIDLLEARPVQDHTKILFKGRGWKIPEDAPCTHCGDFAVDTHHYRNRGSGSSKYLDYYENLIPLCRLCHDIAGVDKEFNHKVYIKNLENIIEHEKDKHKNGDYSK